MRGRKRRERMRARSYVAYLGLACAVVTSLLVGAGERIGLNFGSWGFTVMAIPAVVFVYELLRAWWKLDGDRDWEQPKMSDRGLVIFSFWCFYLCLFVMLVLFHFGKDGEEWLALIVSAQPLVVWILEQWGLM